jgi:hypothetical protein
MRAWEFMAPRTATPASSTDAHQPGRCDVVKPRPRVINRVTDWVQPAAGYQGEPTRKKLARCSDR